MRIAILAAGLARGTPQNALVEEYLTRVRGIGRQLGVVSLTVEETSLSKLREPRARIAEEGENLASRIPAGVAKMFAEKGIFERASTAVQLVRQGERLLARTGKA